MTTASSNTNTISGASSSGGAHGTWSPFATNFSTGGIGEGAQAMAASTPLNIVVISNSLLQNTKDGGSTWSSAHDPASGAGWFSTFESQILLVAADRVTANTFYAYNGGQGSNGKFYVSAGTSGDSWTTYSPAFSFGQSFTPQVKAVPGNAGHVFVSGGQSSTTTHPDSSSKFYRSTNANGGSATFADVSNGSYVIREVWAFGFGAIAAGQTYPSIGLWGSINSVFGFWVSVDNCVTWQLKGDAQFGATTFDIPQTIEGDSNTAGIWYVGFSGSGYLRYGT